MWSKTDFILLYPLCVEKSIDIIFECARARSPLYMWIKKIIMKAILKILAGLGKSSVY